VLSCGGAVNACGFVSFYPSNISEFNNIDKTHCINCQKLHCRRLSPKVYEHININEILKTINLEMVNNMISSLGSIISYKQLYDFQVADVRIGDLVIESIQRSLFETTHKNYSIEKGTVAYEYLRSGIIYALVSNEIFSNISFDFTLGNEISYIDWGIPARFSVKYGVNYIHQSHHYPGEQFLMLAEHSTLDGMKRPPYIPTLELFQKLKDQNNLFLHYKYIGGQMLTNFLGLKVTSASRILLANELGENFNVNRQNIVIFTHLCWDSAQSYGDLLYDSFEEWLNDVFNIAISRPDLNWIFKIHPAEVNFPVSKHFNTTTFLELKWEKEKPINIFILKGDSRIRSVDLIPFTTAGLSALGTVCLELSFCGVPCLLSTRLGYAEFPFIYSAKSISEYREMVFRIDSLTPPTKVEQDMASALFGLCFSKDSYISVETLFEKSDSSDRKVSTKRLQNYLALTKFNIGFQINK
jgi:hypothetical protein